MHQGKRFHTLGLLALRLGVQEHQLRKLVRRRAIPFSTAGRLHLVAEEDEAQVRETLRQAGYLRDAALTTAE